MKNIKAFNLNTNSGAPAQHQIVITYSTPTKEVRLFQSYGVLIARNTLNKKTYKRTCELSRNYWDYSRTTARYRNQYLGGDTKQVKKNLKNGVYCLASLNGDNRG